MCLRFASYVSIVVHELIRITPILVRRDQTRSMLCLVNYENRSSI